MLLMFTAVSVLQAAEKSYPVTFVYADGKLYSLKSEYTYPNKDFANHPYFLSRRYSAGIMMAPFDSSAQNSQKKDTIMVKASLLFAGQNFLLRHKEVFSLNFTDAFSYTEDNDKVQKYKDDIKPLFISDNEFNRRVLETYEKRVAELVWRQILCSAPNANSDSTTIAKWENNLSRYWTLENKNGPIAMYPIFDAEYVSSEQEPVLLERVMGLTVDFANIQTTSVVKKSIKSDLILFVTDDDMFYVSKYMQTTGSGMTKKEKYVSFPFVNLMTSRDFTLKNKEITHDIVTFDFKVFYHDNRLHQLDVNCPMTVSRVSYDPDAGPKGTLSLLQHYTLSYLTYIQTFMAYVDELPDFEWKEFTGKMVLSSFANPNKSIMLVLKNGKVMESVVMSE